jgi:hypothetical protein
LHRRFQIVDHVFVVHDFVIDVDQLRQIFQRAVDDGDLIDAAKPRGLASITDLGWKVIVA